jgi:hypothetical protein
MTDLRGHLEQIAGPPVEATAEQADADLTRGQRALRRRRTGQGIVAGFFAVAVAAAAVSVNVSADGGSGNAPSPAVAAPAARLVAYTGAQPKGFTIDKVPEGWFIQSDVNSNLLLAPKSAQNPKPGVDPSTDPLYDKNSYVGKIAIMLESKDQSGPDRDGIAVKVGDQNGQLLKSLTEMVPGQPAGDPNADTGWTLWVKQPSGIYLLVQFAENLGLSQDQMAELGAGVHVHKGAVQGVG